MAFTDEQQGGAPPHAENPSVDQPGERAAGFEPGSDLDDGYPTEDSGTQTAVATVPAAPSTPPPDTKSGGGGKTPPPPTGQGGDGNGGDEDDDGMLRMSFLEHLEELRARLIKALLGIGVAFVLSLTFTNELWRIVAQPAVGALKTLGFPNPGLTQITPMRSEER